MTNYVLKKGTYQHYKGNYYEVVDLAQHTETLEEMVVYRALHGDHGLWVRPKSMFLEEVEVNHQKIPRFNFIAKNEVKK